MLDADRLVGLLAEPERRPVAAALILAADDLPGLVAGEDLGEQAT